MHFTCLIIIHDPGMRQGLESNLGPLDWQTGALPKVNDHGLHIHKNRLCAKLWTGRCIL